MIRGSDMYQDAIRRERESDAEMDEEAYAGMKTGAKRGARRSFSKYVHHYFNQVEGGI